MQVGEQTAIDDRALRSEVARLQEMTESLRALVNRSAEWHRDDGRGIRSGPSLRMFLMRRRISEIRDQVDALEACAAARLARPPRMMPDAAFVPEQLASIESTPRSRMPSLRRSLLLALAVVEVAVGASLGFTLRQNESSQAIAPPSVPLANREWPRPLEPTGSQRGAAITDQVTAPGVHSGQMAARFVVERPPTGSDNAVTPPDPAEFNQWGWTIHSTTLANDGSDFGNQNWQDGLWNLHWIALQDETGASTSDFAVEAEIRVVSRPECGSFGLVAGGAYQAGMHFCSEYGRPVFSIRSAAPELLIAAPFEVDDAWHHYRLEVRGRDVRGLVDGAVAAEVAETEFPSNGRLGLWDDHTGLAVRDFRVVPLGMD